MDQNRVSGVASRLAFSEVEPARSSHYLFLEGGQQYSTYLRQLAFQVLRDRLETAELNLVTLGNKIKELEKQTDEVVRQQIRLGSSLSGAMDLVAAFSKSNKDSIRTVFLGWADSEFRFVIVGRSPAFDWELCDKVSELETDILEDYEELPFSCKCLPSSAEAEVTAVLEKQICELKKENLV